MSPGEGGVVCIIPFGGGAGTPTVGISPAKAEPDRAQQIAKTIKSRFMYSLLKVW
jgi:hypothetical protein